MDAFGGAGFVVVGEVTANADGADEVDGVVADEHSSGAGDQISVGRADECVDEVGWCSARWASVRVPTPMFNAARALVPSMRSRRPKSGWGTLSLYGILKELQIILVAILGKCPTCRQTPPT